MLQKILVYCGVMVNQSKTIILVLLNPLSRVGFLFLLFFFALFVKNCIYL